MRPRTFHPKLKRSKKTEALSRLKILWEEENEGEFDPSLEPKITPMLRSVPGGFRAVMEALRMHNDEDARKFIRLYDSRTASDRENLRIEDIAFASGVGSLRLAEVAQTALFLYGPDETKMLLSSAMPKVMKSTIKAATDEVPIIADIEKENRGRPLERRHQGHGDVPQDERHDASAQGRADRHPEQFRRSIGSDKPSLQAWSARRKTACASSMR